MDDQRIDVLTATYADFTGHSVNFAKLVREKKRAIIESDLLPVDLEQLTAAALAIARADWRTRDLSPQSFARGGGAARSSHCRCTELTAPPANSHDDDRRILGEAMQSARIGSPEIDAAAFDFCGGIARETSA